MGIMFSVQYYQTKLFSGTNDPANDNYGGSELEYIWAIDRSTFEYSDTIQNAGNRG